MHDFLNAIFGLDSSSRDMAVLQMAARAVLIYLALVIIVRLGKKRFLGDATVFDVVLSVMIGSIAGRTITGAAPILPTLGALIALVCLHWLFSWMAVRSPSFSALIKGTADVIIRHGKVNRRAMKRAHMGEDDLDEDLRNEGVDNPREVRAARLERSGKLSVVRRSRK